MSSLNLLMPKIDPAVERFLKHCHSKRHPKGDRIIHAGDPSSTLYYIIGGSVSVMIEDETGHEMVLAYLNQGDFFGEMGLFDHEARSALVTARTECEVAEISYSKFKEIAYDDPEIMMLLSTQLAHRLRATSRKVINLAFLDVAGRVARTLLDLAHQPDAITHPQGRQLRITRQEIAKIVGCSREMAGRVLKELEEQGLISAHGKTVVVFDPENQ